ncbi:hypothetical protein BJX76DRAFT_348655 [Aspergillus varians]
MSPKKRSGSVSPEQDEPRCRLRHIAELEQSTPLERQTSALCAISSNPDTGESWPSMYEAAKRRATSYKPTKRPNDLQLTSTLLAFLEWLPEQGQRSVAKDINEAQTDESLWEVFHNLVTGLLYPMKARSTKNSVTPSPHSWRRSNAEVVAAALMEPQSRGDKFREDCLRRDGDRCVISKSMSSDAWTKLGRPSDVRSTYLEAAHIIPFSYASWDNSSVCDLPSSKPTAATSDVSDAWEVLFRCFPAVRRMGLRVEKINELFNEMTLTRDLHYPFGVFTIALVATDIPHLYKVKAYPECPTDIQRQLPEDSLVRFEKAKGAEHLPLPDPACLDCHHRLAEILHISGMGDYIDKKLRDWEQLKGSAGPGHLSADGTTDIRRFLQVALWQSVAG